MNNNIIEKKKNIRKVNKNFNVEFNQNLISLNDEYVNKNVVNKNVVNKNVVNKNVVNKNIINKNVVNKNVVNNKKETKTFIKIDASDEINQKSFNIITNKIDDLERCAF